MKLETSKVLESNEAKNFTVVELKDGKVAFVFDPKKELGDSKSGKTTLISTTSGAVKVNGFTISMNVYTKK
jgi:hypothetical protein